jgi:VanZ family protein
MHPVACRARLAFAMLARLRMLALGRPGRYVLLIAWMALITFWSGQSELPIDQPLVASMLRGLQHKLAHVVGFGVLALLARWAFDGSPRAGLRAVLLTAGFGAFDELHQAFTPGRRPGVDDWLVDTLAAVLAMWAWNAVATRARRVVPAVTACVVSLCAVALLFAVLSG